MITLLLAACVENTQPGTSADSDIIDDRLEPADVEPVPEGGEQWFGPEVVIEPNALPVSPVSSSKESFILAMRREISLASFNSVASRSARLVLSMLMRRSVAGVISSALPCGTK